MKAPEPPAGCSLGAVPPGPAFVPDKVVQDSRFDSERRGRQVRPPEAEEDREDRDLESEPEEPYAIEDRPAAHSMV